MKLLAIILSCYIFTGVTVAQTLSTTAANFPDYKLDVVVEPDRHQLEVSGTLKLPPAQTTRNSFVVALTEQAKNLRVEAVEPVTAIGAISVEKVDRANVPAGIRRWKFVLPRDVAPNQPILIKFQYEIPGGLDSVFYIGPEGSFASGVNTAWYPELEDADQFRMRATGTIRFRVPPTYLAYATGIRQEPSGGVLEFRVTKPVFFAFGIGKYTVARRPGPVPVSVFMLKPRPHARVQQLLEGSAKVIEALAKEFGPYPHHEFAVVEMPIEQARRGGSDGASLSGFMLGISSYFDQDFNVAFFGHEIGHTWWGNLIQRKGPRGGYMLDEAMAQYGSLRAVEIIEGPEMAETYRRTGYPGYYSEYSGATYLQRSLAGLDHALAELPISHGFLSRRLANTKGMLVWDMLSRTVGRQKFNQILHNFTQRNFLRRVTWEDFLKAISDGAGEDLNWFYEQWFERKGVPGWQLTWSQRNGIVNAVITQNEPFYKATLDLEAETDNGRHYHRKVQINGRRTGFRWPLRQKVKTLRLDPDFQTLHWTPEYRAEAQALLPYTQAELQLAQGQLKDAQSKFTEALSLPFGEDPHGLQFLLEYGLAQSLLDQNQIQEAKTHVERALKAPVRRAEVLPFVYLQLATVARKLNDEVMLRNAIEAVVKADAAVGGRTGTVEQARALLKPDR